MEADDKILRAIDSGCFSMYVLALQIEKRFIKMMKNLMLIGCVAGCLLFSCKESTDEIKSFKMEIGKIHKIELIDEKDVTFGSMDSAKIGEFVSFLLTAGPDNTGRDFKSYDFIRFYGSNGKTFQIEIFKNLFKAKEKVFIVDSKIIKKMKAIFNNDALIETPPLNTR
jgi:hypothetical protein